MSYSDAIPVVCALLYAVQGIIMLTQHNYGFALMWASYALANIGIMYAAKGTV